MKKQKMEEWCASGCGGWGKFGGCDELAKYVGELIKSGKIIISIVPTRYYGSNQSDIEMAIIIMEEEN